MIQDSIATVPMADCEYSLFKAHRKAVRLCLTLLFLLIVSNVIWAILWLTGGL